MPTAEDLLKLARALPKAKARPVTGSYAHYEGYVRAMQAKGYSGRAMVDELLKARQIPQDHADRTRHGIYRILRRLSRQTSNAA